MNAPVVLFVYNRLDHTKNVIESLAKNVLAENTDLYIFSDAAKTENGIEKVNEVRKYIQSTDWRDSFQKVAIVEAEAPYAAAVEALVQRSTPVVAVATIVVERSTVAVARSRQFLVTCCIERQ